MVSNVLLQSTDHLLLTVCDTIHEDYKGIHTWNREGGSLTVVVNSKYDVKKYINYSHVPRLPSFFTLHLMPKKLRKCKKAAKPGNEATETSQADRDMYTDFLDGIRKQDRNNLLSSHLITLT